MTSPRTRFIRTAAAIGGLSAAGALLVPGIASADPGPAGPLVNTTCTFAQVDAALHDKAPQVAQRLDENPDRKALVQQFFDLSIDQRGPALDQFLANNPQAQELRDRAQSGPYAEQVRQTVADIADTCHNY